MANNMIEFTLFDRVWRGPRMTGSAAISMSAALRPILADTVLKQGADMAGWIALCSDPRANPLAEETLENYTVDGMPIRALRDRIFEGCGADFIEGAAEVWRREGFFRIPGQAQMDLIMIGVGLAAQRFGVALRPEVATEVQKALKTWGSPSPTPAQPLPEGV